MPTIGYDSTTDVFDTTIPVGDPHILLDIIGQTFTASSGDSVTEVGFYSTFPYSGSMQIGVYRTDTLALINSATVSANGVAGRKTTTVTWPLTAGVTYVTAFRVITDVDTARSAFTDSTGFVSALTGSSALANPFVISGAGARFFPVFATVASSGSSATVTPAPAVITVSGRAPTTSAFNNVRIREVLVNESGQVVGGAANITLLVWYSGRFGGAPDISLNGMTTDAAGTTSWSIATGTLAYNQPIAYVAQDSISFSNYTCARMIPSYE